jgi:uncharacterized damage-inducible protein DinB
VLTAQQLAEAHGRNVGIIKAQTAGLTHDESLLQLPFRGNCLNWVIGHILEGRNTILELLGAEPAFDPAAAARYARNSEPILADGPDVVPLEELLRTLERSQEHLAAKMAALTDADLARDTPFFNRSMSLGELLFFLYFHDTYHTGQAEPLRQLAGKDDKII